MSAKPQSIGTAPVNIDTHEADKARRAQARAKTKRFRDNCLDPTFAADAEARKPVFEFSIKCSYMKPQEKGGVKRTELTDQIVAKTENDAWAMFSDKYELPVGRGTAEVEIKNLGQRKASND